MGFLGCFWHTMIPIQSILPYVFFFKIFLGCQNSLKCSKMPILTPSDIPRKMWNRKYHGKMLWIGITTYQSYPRNPLRERNSVKTKLQCPIFEFLEIFYTFLLNFYSKIRVSRGGVKWPPIKPNFFLPTFYNICAQNKKAQPKTQKKWKSETPYWRWKSGDEI